MNIEKITSIFFDFNKLIKDRTVKEILWNKMITLSINLNIPDIITI